MVEPAHVIMRRPVAVLVVTAAVMLSLAIPAFGLHVTSGDNRNTPPRTEAPTACCCSSPARAGAARAPPGRHRHRAPGRGPRPPRSPPSSACWHSCASDPRIEPATIQAPAGALLRGRQARQPDRPQRRAADPRRRAHRRGHPNRRRPGAQDPRHLHPARPAFPPRDHVYSPAPPRSGWTSSTRPTAPSRGCCWRCS